MIVPEMSGTELLEHLCGMQRDIRAIIHTAYGSFESARDAVNLGAFAYVEKHPEELVRHGPRGRPAPSSAVKTGTSSIRYRLSSGVAIRRRPASRSSARKPKRCGAIRSINGSMNRRSGSITLIPMIGAGLSSDGLTLPPRSNRWSSTTV